MKNFLEKYKNFSLEIPFQSIKNFGYLNRKIPSILISPNFFKEDGGIDGFIACLKKLLIILKCIIFLKNRFFDKI